MTDIEDLEKSWCRAMWNTYNAFWNKYVEPYLFSEEPPFRISRSFLGQNDLLQMRREGYNIPSDEKLKQLFETKDNQQKID